MRKVTPAKLFLIGLFVLPMQSRAAKHDVSYRNFWLPQYHGERLNYCSLDKKVCGQSLASRYCQWMGYDDADQAVIDHNVGLTHYMFHQARCKGWRCNGFKTIRCVSALSHKPKVWHYRQRRFVVPRYQHYRVDWCYDGKQGCGKRAAFSFCRRMAYLDVKQYKIEKNTAATKAIGNQKLCFGARCNAFAYIDCFR